MRFGFFVGLLPLRLSGVDAPFQSSGAPQEEQVLSVERFFVPQYLHLTISTFTPSVKETPVLTFDTSDC